MIAAHEDAFHSGERSQTSQAGRSSNMRRFAFWHMPSPCGTCFQALKVLISQCLVELIFVVIFPLFTKYSVGFFTTTVILSVLGALRRQFHSGFYSIK